MIRPFPIPSNQLNVRQHSGSSSGGRDGRLGGGVGGVTIGLSFSGGSRNDIAAGVISSRIPSRVVRNDSGAFGNVFRGSSSNGKGGFTKPVDVIRDGAKR